ncbi:MAG: hypothetical protein KJO05_09845 [Bacteroidia bacterium]|nr:hypothetical protein [Bacteroidia bacterium]NNF30196.1 hypothetical protein [Flavobacteriaceae bacterium]MBT8275481.1 hypothetical protein [Bacteroidia bacterium]NNJ81224.1 hypothetical protein [Flavobacteriaceae bacterium]NNK54413.1 hypothetical protein [Flavobacteriaceae bacterium]
MIISYLLPFYMAFLIMVFKELSLTDFKKVKDRYIWMVLIVAFGVIGYFFYFSFKRKLITERKFHPDFTKTRYYQSKSN